MSKSILIRLNAIKEAVEIVDMIESNHILKMVMPKLDSVIDDLDHLGEVMDWEVESYKRHGVDADQLAGLLDEISADIGGVV